MYQYGGISFSLLSVITLLVRGRRVFRIQDTDISLAMSFGWNLKGHVLQPIPYITLLDCVQQCLSRGRCNSLNYRPHFQICELNHKTKGEVQGEDLLYVIGGIYMERSDWTQVCRHPLLLFKISKSVCF